MENTTYLHNHSVYSLFDGAQTIKEMVERAKELGCKNLALTDHGTMIGIPKFVAECKKNDIKPLIGVEIYMQNPDDIIENMNIVNKGHSYLYAVNNEGYTQLCHILSDSEKNQIRSGKSVYPITTFEILEKYVKRGDLIYTTACVGGYIPQVLYFNEKQNIKINEINKKLRECSSPEDTDYKLLCKEIDDIRLQKELMDKAFDTYMKAEDEYRTEYYTYEVLNGEYEMQEALMSNKADKSKKKEIMNINKLKKQYKEAKEIYKKQTAIFNMLDYPEVDDSFNCAEEKNLLGLYITKTPLSGYPEPSEIGCIAIADINVADNIKILANITEIKEILTKKGEKMAFINCEDNSGTLSAVIFPKIWSKFYTAISTGVVYILTGRYEIKDGKSSFIINDINESLTNGEDLLVHVDSWKEWNTKYYPEAIKKSSINGSTLYVHNRKSGQIIRFSKKIKNFSNFKEAKYAFIHK